MDPGRITQIGQQVQQIIAGPNAPKGDVVAAISTVGAIFNAVAEVAAPIITVVAGSLGIVWWVLRIRSDRRKAEYERLRSEQDTELHEHKMGRD